MKLRVLENFAGIGTQRMALENLGIEHEVVGITEIDKFAIKSYEAIHGEVNNLGDISLVDPNDVPDHDLFTYSFPCQDISVAGKGKGFEKDSGTRSGLLWECEKVIRTKKPKYLLMENVKNLVSKKFKPGFEEWLRALEDMGYTNYWKVLNAKDYGIPQNRERVFCVSILGEHEPYEFPEKETLELRLKDILEHEVDEKYYLSEERVDQLTLNWDKVLANKDLQVVGNTSATGYNKSNVYHEDGISPTLAARDYKGPTQVLQVGQYDTKTRTNSNRYRTYSPDGISASLTTMGGGGREPHVMLDQDKTQTLDTSDSKGVGVDNSDIKPINPLKGKTTNGWHFEQQVYDDNGITRAVKAGGGSGNIPKTIEELRIRKLTPKECWRLMGISDDDFEKAQEVNSNTQLYKQAGNAIVVDVLEAIFANMFK